MDLLLGSSRNLSNRHKANLNHNLNSHNLSSTNPLVSHPQAQPVLSMRKVQPKEGLPTANSHSPHRLHHNHRSNRASNRHLLLTQH